MVGKRTTVKDVARFAGVSPGTVSNAISGQRRVDVETKARIEAAIQELGYKPNFSARGMRTGKASTIAIFSSMPSAVAAGLSRLGFLMEVAASAAITALEHNLALMLVPPIDCPETALATIAFDGAILIEPTENDPYRNMLLGRGVPVVEIGPAETGHGPVVLLDYKRMAELLIDHMIVTGARNFPLVIGCSSRASNRLFRMVYETQMAVRKLPTRIIEVVEHNAEAGSRQAILGELDSGRVFDGILVPIDAMATGVMSALRARGLRVPYDVRVSTRYDGIRARSETPALTALDLQLDAVARIATNALVKTINDGSTSTTLAPHPQLIIRDSTFKST